MNKVAHNILKSAFFSFVVLLAGCAAPVTKTAPEVKTLPQGAVYHKVQAGETIWRIAKKYNVSIDDIIKANKIPNVAVIEKDQLILIPVPGAAVPTEAKETSEIKISSAAPLPVKSNDFEWPLKGKIISYFGEQRDAHLNSGVDIEGAAGNKVLASRNGRVVFADYLNGNGFMVILDHGDGYFTVYSQNANALVKLGDRVARGQPIAEMGKTGELAFLHFEIRKNASADNPLFYLP